MPLIKFSQTERRRISMFFICLGVAISAWLFFALSNSYVYQARTLVRFVNFPQNKAFHSLQSDTVKLQIEGTGWQLLFSKLRISPQSVDIDLKDLNKQTFVNLSDQLGYINQQFSSTQKIVYVQPDTLYFDFSSRAIKKVPVELVGDLQFQKQYGISDSVKIKPAYVTITGPKNDLSKIRVWKTDSLNVNNINASISTRLPFKRPSMANINIYPSYAEISVPVEEFTEKTIEVSIKVGNNRNYRDINLLPEKVKITFMTALGNYSKIDRDYFEATVDLDKWTERSYKQLPVILTRFPAFCKLVRIEPQAIDFIIQK
ncbi:YbbR-like domain-containing protein [Daejeonella sp.]|uniref:CdaR family protein n=1 Tax=Daejeonella sp. TaxID=2805397 RepID=UPI0039836567